MLLQLRRRQPQQLRPLRLHTLRQLGHRVVRISRASALGCESHAAPTNLIRNPHRSRLAASVCACHVGWTHSSLCPVFSPVRRTQYYTQFQHSHYPQASYGHYQPYIPPAQTAQTQTPGPVTAAVQRQPALETGQVDTTDVATLNDAIGSAGVDLRVRALTHLDHRSHAHIPLSTIHRQKKNRYSVARINIRRIVRMKIARGSSRRRLTLIRASWGRRCAQ